MSTTKSAAGVMTTNAARIAEQLRKEIIRRSIKAGERITVAELSARFGVSGAPVREALQQLGSEGYLEIIPNRGAVARTFGPSELYQVFSVREALQVYQAKRFAEVVTDENIAQLRVHARDFGEAVEQRKMRALHDANERLHHIINAHDDNTELMLILDRHSDVSRMMRRDFGQTTERLTRAVDEHYKLIEAFESRDAAAAGDIVSRHIRGTLDDIIACYEKRGGTVIR